MHKHLLHDSHHKQQGHGHSLKDSQTQKTSTETSHSRTGSPSPSYVVSPLRTFFDRCSPLPHKEPFMSIDPFRFYTPLSLSPFARCCSTHAQESHGDGDIEDYTVVSVRYLVYVRMYATITVAPHASTVRIYSHSKYSHVNFTCMIGCAYLCCTFRASCVYCSHNLNLSGSSMGAQSLGRRAHNIAQQASCCRSQTTGFHQMFLPLWLGSSSRGRVLSLCSRKRGKRIMCCWLCFFGESSFFCARGADTVSEPP